MRASMCALVYVYVYSYHHFCLFAFHADASWCFQYTVKCAVKMQHLFDEIFAFLVKFVFRRRSLAEKNRFGRKYFTTDKH